MPTVAERPPATRLQLLLAFAAVYVVWGSTYLGIRFAIETIPPFSMAGIRFVAAGGLLYGWTRLRGAGRPSLVHWRTAAVVGGLLLVGGNGAVTWAELRIPSGAAALLVASMPLWMVLLDWARPGGRRPAPAVWLGLALGFAGVALLVGPGEIAGGDALDPVGAAAVVGGAFVWALGSVYSRGAPQPPQLLQGAAMQMLVAGVLLLLVGLGLGERIEPAAFSLRSGLALAYLIGAGSLVGFTAYVWLLQHTTAARASTYAYVNPAVAVLLGWALAGEPLNARVFAATAVIVGAVALITTARAKGAGRA